MTEVWKFLVNSVKSIKNLYDYRLYRIKRWVGAPPRIKRLTIKKFHIKNILGFGAFCGHDQRTILFTHLFRCFILDGTLLKKVHLWDCKSLQFLGHFKLKLKCTISTIRCIYLFVRNIPPTVIIDT